MRATDTKVETPHIAWRRATEDLRQAIYDEVYEARLAQANEERKPHRIADREKLAHNVAKGEVTKRLFEMREYDGVPNPVYDGPWSPDLDKEWNAKIRGDVPPTDDHDELVDWLEEQTWSDFAQSLAKQYRTKGSLSPKQVNAAKNMRKKVERKRKEKEAQETGLDLSGVPSGYYAVPEGDTRLKVRIARGKDGTKWEGWTFVSDGAEYGQRRNYGTQKPDGTYRGAIEDKLRAIVEDPTEAMKAYGHLVGRCGACNRLLEDEESIRKGIGPICAQKL